MSKKGKGRNYLIGVDGVQVNDLGRVMAECDDRLPEYYIQPELYLSRALAMSDPSVFFMGPKGVGKSAVLQMVRLEKRSEERRIINVYPDDLAFSALANIDVSTPLLEDASKNQWLFTSLWDYILTVDILRREYPSHDLWGKALTAIFGSFEQRAARRLLKVSLGDDGAPQSLTDRIIQLIDEVNVAGKGEGYELTAGVSLKEAPNQRAERLKLLSQINHVAKTIPHQLKHEYYVLIDDLDLHWQDNPVQNSFIAALFLSLRRLSRSAKLKFAVAIRSDIFRSLPLEDRDKSRDFICSMSWDKAAIRKMVNARVRTFLNCHPEEIWNQVFPLGSFDRMWSHTGGMPRELIRIAALCISTAKANAHLRVEEDDVESAIRAFSEECIENIASEWQRSLPGLDFVIRRFRGWPKEFDMTRFDDFVLQIETDIAGSAAISKKASWAGGFLDDPMQLARMLLECGILLLKPSRTASPEEYDPDQDMSLDRSSWLAIHPRYHVALGLAGA